MKVRFYKIPVFINTIETERIIRNDGYPDPEEYQTTILYLMDHVKINGMLWNQELTQTEFTFKNKCYCSPLKPQEIMDLELIEYNGKK